MELDFSDRLGETVPCAGAAFEKARSPNVLRRVVCTVKIPAESDREERADWESLSSSDM